MQFAVRAFAMLDQTSTMYVFLSEQQVLIKLDEEKRRTSESALIGLFKKRGLFCLERI